MKPLKDLLLIKLDKRQEQTASGIYFKEAWESAINSGTIEDGGPDSTIAVGTRVVVNPYALLDCGKHKEGIYLIKEADVIATLEDGIEEAEVISGQA